MRSIAKLMKDWQFTGPDGVTAAVALPHTWNAMDVRTAVTITGGVPAPTAPALQLRPLTRHSSRSGCSLRASIPAPPCC